MPTTSTTAAAFDTAQTSEIAQALRHLLADVFVLYLKTKGFHWGVGGRHFREDHMLLDEQANQLFGMVDDIAERIRKIGGSALRSVSDVARYQRLKDNSEDGLSAVEMFRELLDDNRQLTKSLRHTHALCDRHRDVATASLIENWIDESERRVWFLDETTRARGE
jgi:starvation-inducible DNA-binding protein